MRTCTQEQEIQAVAWLPSKGEALENFLIMEKDVVIKMVIIIIIVD